MYTVIQIKDMLSLASFATKQEAEFYVNYNKNLKLIIIEVKDIIPKNSIVKEKMAKNEKGYLLFNPKENKYFFRIYGAKDLNTLKITSVDYNLKLERISIIINDENASLYEFPDKPEENKLDFSTKCRKFCK